MNVEYVHVLVFTHQQKKCTILHLASSASNLKCLEKVFTFVRDDSGIVLATDKVITAEIFGNSNNS